ncbi:MAG: altronate dehydratase [Eggerthellaceae bacterium]|nr:altronate dehydratase [Eggerthellaceae bacterium]
MQQIKIHPFDNVIVALEEIPRGTKLEGDGFRVTTKEDIHVGHKIAIAQISQGNKVVKYGYTIGNASQDIEPGSWVHVNNVKTGLSEDTEYLYEHKVFKLPELESKTFKGFRRKDGKVGVRNELWVIPTVGCANGIASELVRSSKELVKGNIDGLYYFGHPFGCSQMGADHAQTRKLLAALARHPNAGGVLVLALGCENLTLDQFKEELSEWDDERVKFVVSQEVEDEIAAGSETLKEIAEFAGSFQREEIPAGELVVGMKCGGSDGLSGITANPAVGRFSDMLISLGGSTILTEVPEMFGAESILFNRCKNKEVFDKAVKMVNDFKQYYVNHGQVVYENPSPGNKKGGITTLEDKSCGCVQKGGLAQVVDVLDYGEQVTKKGLNLLSGPGNDLVSATALTAAHAHIVLFTTGRGTPFGAPAPTVKISSNTLLFRKKPAWVDFNAGRIAESESIETVSNDLLNYVLEVASGKQTNNEKHGVREISIFKDGVVL